MASRHRLRGPKLSSELLHLDTLAVYLLPREDSKSSEWKQSLLQEQLGVLHGYVPPAVHLQPFAFQDAICECWWESKTTNSCSKQKY